MMLASEQPEHYDYDNPTHSMSFDDTPPRGAGSGHDIRDAGVVRPNMINILSDDDMPRAMLPDDEDIMADPLPRAADEDVQQKGGKKGNKIKGLFGKKKKKDKEPKIEDEDTGDKRSSVGGKLKGMFKRKSGEQKADLDPVVLTPESQTTGFEVPNPAYDPNSPQTPIESPGSMAAAFDEPPAQTSTLPKKNPFSSFMRRPQPISDTSAKPFTQVEVDGTERLQLKPEPPQSHFRCSNVLNLVLLVGIILGILFLALSSQSQTLAVIGPVFLGLSLFALVGKIFFTLFWQEDPLPMLKPYVAQFEQMLGPSKPAAPQRQVVIARSSMYGEKHGIRDEEANLPPDLPYQDFDENIDTRMRTTDDVNDVEAKRPTFI